MSAAFECSHPRVGKLRGHVISRGFVVRTQHFRILETCRIDFALVNKGLNVSFHMKSCSTAQTEIQIYPASGSSPSVCLSP